jgi:tripartite-type tricarboxylate transporter receptor subunit TctC
MNCARRKFMQLTAGAAALAAVPRIAPAQSWAQAYPTHPARIIVGWPPGGVTDIVARLMGQWLTERLGQQFVIENRPGGNTNVATEAVVRAPADGYTLVMISSTNTINATLYDKLSFNFIRDIAPVAAVIRVPIVLEVNQSIAAATIPELVVYAKANPGKLSMASPGNGTPSHVSGEMFKMMTGIEMVHVPYRGDGAAIVDLLAGQVQVLFNALPTSIEYIKDGRLRALGVATPKRLDVLPDVPTINEFAPGFETSFWLGLGVAKGTPPEIVDRLNAEINAGLADAKVRARLGELGGTVLAGSSTDFGRLLAEETEKWAKVIQFAGIKVD